MFKVKLNSKQAKDYLSIKSDDTLRKHERNGLKTNRFPGSNRKYWYESDLEKYLLKG